MGKIQGGLGRAGRRANKKTFVSELEGQTPSREPTRFRSPTPPTEATAPCTQLALLPFFFIVPLFLQQFCKVPWVRLGDGLERKKKRSCHSRLAFFCDKGVPMRQLCSTMTRRWFNTYSNHVLPFGVGMGSIATSESRFVFCGQSHAQAFAMHKIDLRGSFKSMVGYVGLSRGLR
jgi:hypothetical protein